MIKKCPECRKENNAEINVCPCGFRFMNPEDILKMQEFSPPKRGSLNISGILTFGVFLIVGLVAVAFFIGMPSFLIQTIGSSEEKVSLAEINLPPPPPEKNTLSPLRTRSVIGKVTSVKSGDLITVFDELTEQDYEIKLAGIKAPELNRKFGQKSQENLSSLVLEKEVFVFFKSPDESNVQFGKVILVDKDINLEQIKSGLAEYDKSTTTVLSDIELDLYAKAEATAKASEIGWWSAATLTDGKSADLQSDKGSSAENPKTLPDDKSVSEKRTETSPPTDTATRNDSRSEQIADEHSKPQNVPAKRQNLKSKPSEKASGTPTARCQDGTLSYSKSVSGACSYHGGVADWLGKETKSSAKKKESEERKYIQGSRGGCYYVNGNGSKVYVDRSLCS